MIVIAFFREVQYNTCTDTLILPDCKPVYEVQYMNNEIVLQQVLKSFQDSAIRDRSYYPEFRRQWEALLRRAAESGEAYFDIESDSVFSVEHRFAGIETVFHFDQLKIADWYRQELGQKKHIVFKPQKLKHDSRGLRYHEYVCSYSPDAPEPMLNEENRNIIAAAMPELPARLQIVYGNKWVDGRFNAFLKSRLSVFLINTDYVPAFLATPFELCLYFFLMDYCIIKENYTKVKDEELKQFLHIFKTSPMLKIKGLL